MVIKDWEKGAYKKLMAAPDKMMEALKSAENEQPVEDVIHLSYSGSVISEENILKFKKQLESVGLKLRHYNTDGNIQACHFEVNNEILFQYTLGGIVGGAAWDIIKTLTLWMWEQGKTKMVNVFQNDKVTKHHPTTTFVIPAGKHKSIVYIIPNELPTRTVKKGVENLMELTKTHQKKYEGKKAYYEYYRLQKNGMWKHTKLEPSKKELKQSKELLKKLRNVKA